MPIEFSQLSVGDKASIEECRTTKASLDPLSPSQVQRLMMMGLTPGTTFTVVRVAPLGDPIEIKLRGFNLSLRREEALGLWVTRL
jgi:ferrous iron transport protein A